MVRLFDWLVEFWDRIRGFLGFHRLTKKGRRDDLAGRGLIRRVFYFVRPLLMLFVLIYLGTMIWRFSWVRGEDLSYPQTVIGDAAPVSAGAETEPESGTAGVKTCAPSQIVRVEQALIDMLVNQNDWTPATPQYKFGFFFVLPWEATPFFDNKASFQKGVLGAVRRFSLELTDTLGRVRGTSGADPDLEAARGLVQLDERTWLFNPFDARLPLLATSAASSYRNAIRQFDAYNARLAACDALFDARADNLYQLLDRITKEMGSTVDQISQRSQSRSYDVKTHEFIEATGNSRGWFDFRADNYFHEARGRMYAYHGLMQAARVDFADVVKQRNLDDVWDRMEAHIAEAAALSPLIVSNGREDGMFTPAHLSAMAQNMLRARANMTELRDILAR
ncbi:DUF2333 family protein [Pikeienuella piscinae]|uniref:DUF2333 family protein n=1 Tax=Pikeienuella piscinae TaxID=2748098 RepID=A0A7M3T5D4_9RHOB|nr:DUF2333 family protein [Pikeienuella piscinae]QIE57215.1 DUF2333 family protein [Pikeienuella piscinae]